MSLFVRLILPISLIGMLSGCGTAAVTIFEDAAEAVTAQECSVPRVLRGEGALCEEIEEPPEADPVYCFNTLGDVDCYAVPEAMGKTNERRPPEAPPLGG